MWALIQNGAIFIDLAQWNELQDSPGTKWHAGAGGLNRPSGSDAERQHDVHYALDEKNSAEDQWYCQGRRDRRADEQQPEQQILPRNRFGLHQPPVDTLNMAELTVRQGRGRR